jgi:hypothetical protein
MTIKLRCAVEDFDFKMATIALTDIEILLTENPTNEVS